MSSIWSGPISLSLFVPDVELDFATIFLNHLFICDETMASHLAVHLIFPGQKFPKHVSDPVLKKEFPCSTNIAKLLRYYKTV